MILIRIITFLSILFSHALFAQKKVKVGDKIRAIDYYVLSYQENGGFFRKNEELPRILLGASMNQQLDVYEIDYLTGKELLLTPQDLSGKLKKLDDPGNNIEYSPDEMSLIGIDLTEGYRNGEIYHQYNYLNLYVPYHQSAATSNIYICSFRFEDVIRLLDAQHVLWYPESFGLSQGIFTNYGGFTLSQTKWAKNLLEELKYEFSGASFSESANISTYNAYEGYDVEVHLAETRENEFYIPQAIEIFKAGDELSSGENPFICSIPFTEYREYNRDQSTSDILYMSTALLSEKLTPPSATFQNRYENFYDANFKDRTLVSRDGRYLGSNKPDALSIGKKIKTMKSGAEIKNIRFNMQLVERLEPHLEKNQYLYGKNHLLISQIIDSATEKEIQIYSGDSLENQLTLKAFKDQLEPLDHVDLLIELIYKVSFNEKGMQKSYHPLGLGIVHSGNQMNPIGYFRFEALKEILSENQRETIINRHFKGYEKRSSHIYLED